MAAAIPLLVFGLHTAAHAQGVCLRFGDNGGRLLSITDTGNLIEFWSDNFSEHIFSGNVREGWTVCYDGTSAYNIHDDTFGVNAGTCTSNRPTGIYANGTAIVATVAQITWDQKLRVSTVFTWVAGNRFVDIETVIRNNRSSGSVRIETVKRYVDVNVDRILQNSFSVSANGPSSTVAAFIPGGHRFTLTTASASAPGSTSTVLRSYHVDSNKPEWTRCGDGFAEAGKECPATDDDALVSFLDLRGNAGGGLLIAPGQEVRLGVRYAVDTAPASCP